MSNGSAACDTAERPSSFFDKTESNYRNMERRANEARERIDCVCDSISGGQPREAMNKGDAERHPAAFDRCNNAESIMYTAMNMLEESITRLETLGLT